MSNHISASAPDATIARSGWCRRLATSRRSDGGSGDRAAGVAQHQRAPPFADQLQRPGGGALLILVEASKHMDKIAPYVYHATMDHTCMMHAKCEVPMRLKGCQSF